jgi:hypothetical protein
MADGKMSDQFILIQTQQEFHACRLKKSVANALDERSLEHPPKL